MGTFARIVQSWNLISTKKLSLSEHIKRPLRLKAFCSFQILNKVAWNIYKPDRLLANLFINKNNRNSNCARSIERRASEFKWVRNGFQVPRRKSEPTILLFLTNQRFMNFTKTTQIHKSISLTIRFFLGILMYSTLKLIDSIVILRHFLPFFSPENKKLFEGKQNETFFSRVAFCVPMTCWRGEKMEIFPETDKHQLQNKVSS